MRHLEPLTMNSKSTAGTIGTEARVGAMSYSHAFWYSNRAAVAFTLFMLVVVQVISFLTPPFQAPDENSHIKRAYLLSKGDIFLGSQDGATGGAIDTGLLTYINFFDAARFQYSAKYTTSTHRVSKDVKWTGDRQFSRLPNIAFYCPLSYLPQATAIAAGEWAGLSVRDTYYLARLCAALTTLTLILAALLLYPAPRIVLAILFLPMSLFQFGSPALDSISFAAAMLASALFMRGADERFSFNTSMFIGLIVCLFMLAASRIALLPLTLLPLVLTRTWKLRSHLLLSVLLIGMTLAWIVYVMLTVEDIFIVDSSASEIVKHYLLSPISFLRVFVATISDPSNLAAYWRMYVGVLGWLDTPLGSEIYIGTAVLFAVLSILGVLACWSDSARALEASKFWLVSGALSSVVLMYFALLMYNPHPAKVISGIQGRYFIPISIILAYAIFTQRPPRWALRAEITVLALMICVSILGTIPRLLYRYWMA